MNGKSRATGNIGHGTNKH